MTRLARRILSRIIPLRSASARPKRKVGARWQSWHGAWRLEFLKSLPGKIIGGAIRLWNTTADPVARQGLQYIWRFVGLTWAKAVMSLLLVLGFVLVYPDVIRTRLDAFEFHLRWPWTWGDGDSKGLILLDTPQIFTRGRLVNDRTKEADWLFEQLARTDQLLRDQRFRGTQSHYASSRKLDWSAGEAQSALSPAGKPLTASPIPGPGPIDEFTLASNYREAIRNRIMSTVLDDRHDIDGNSIYRLNFNATVLPRKGSNKVGMLVASVREFRDDHLANDEERRKVYIELLHDWRKELESIAERGRNSAEKTLLDGSSSSRLIAQQAQQLNGWVAKKLEDQRSAASENLPSEIPFSVEKYLELAHLAHYQLVRKTWEEELFHGLSSFEIKLTKLVRRLSQERVKLGASAAATGAGKKINATTQIPSAVITLVAPQQTSSSEKSAETPAVPTVILDARITAIASIQSNVQKVLREIQDRKWPQDRKNVETLVLKLCRTHGKGDVSLTSALHPGIRLSDQDAEEISIHVKCPEVLVPELAMLDLAVLLGRPEIICSNRQGGTAPLRPSQKNEIFLARLAALMQTTTRQVPTELAWPCTGKEEALTSLRELPASLEFLRRKAIAEWYAYYLETQPAKIDANAGEKRCDCDPNQRCKIQESAAAQRVTDRTFTRVAQSAPKLSTELRLGHFYNFTVDPGTATIKVKLSSDPPKKPSDPAKTTPGLAEELRSLMCRRAYAHTYAVLGNDTRLAQSRAYESALSAQQGGVRLSEAVSGNGMDRSPLVLGFRDWAEARQAQGMQEPARARFGWAILPQSSEGNGFFKAQQPESYAVSALVALPGWWKTAHLEVRTCWVAQSDLQPQLDLDKFCGSFAEADTHRFDIRLQSPSGNVDLMENLRFFVEKAPAIYLTAPPFVEAGRPGAIRIPGTRLWRSPVVLLGEQQADSIEVLPDMKGIIAKFNCVRWPAVPATHNSGADAEVALVVTTSEGSIPEPSPRATVLPFRPRQIQTDKGQVPERDCDTDEKNRKVATAGAR
jgi:hypothetical protein